MMKLKSDLSAVCHFEGQRLQWSYEHRSPAEAAKCGAIICAG